MLPVAATLPYEQKLQRLFEALDALPGAVGGVLRGVDSTAAAACRAGAARRARGRRHGRLAIAAGASNCREAVALAQELGVRHVVAREPANSEPPGATGRTAATAATTASRSCSSPWRSGARRSGPEPWRSCTGAIVDDLGEHRPGQRAAAEHGVQAPLLDAGFGQDRRAPLQPRRRAAHGRQAELSPAWRRGCRYGTAIAAPLLSQIRARRTGAAAARFRQFRVRHHGEVARIEVAPGELARAVELRLALVAGLKACGYVHVALDLQGYRSGAMNEVLPR